MSFDGTTGSYMTFGSNTPTNIDQTTSNIFVEAWVYFNNLNLNNRIFTRTPFVSSTAGSSDIVFRTAGVPSDVLYFNYGSGGYTGGANVAGLVQGTWCHVAMSSVRGNGISYVFLNGTPGTGRAPPAGTYTAAANTFISAGASNEFSNMYVRDLRVIRGGIIPTAAFTPQAATWAYGSTPSYVTDGTNVLGLAAQYMTPTVAIGTPLFSQLSAAATSSAVGAFSLRAVNGTTAKAVQVTKYTLLEVPPVALTQNTFTATGTFNGVTNGQYVALCSSYNATADAYRCFDKNTATRGLTSASDYTIGTGVFVGSASTVDSTSSTYNGAWLQIKIPGAIFPVLYSVSVHSSLTLTAPYTWKLFGSTTGNSGSWVVLDTRTAYNFTAQTVSFTLASTVLNGYTYFRLAANMISPSSAAGNLGPAELVIYGYSTLVSTAQDFYADRLGNLLTAPVTGQSLTNWLGDATGYITTWYDQSGNVVTRRGRSPLS
jgi:hypothetical protein